MRLFTHAAFFVLTCSSITFGQRRESREQPVIAEVSAALQKHVDSHEISGAVGLVAHQGTIIHLGAVGLADIENGRPMKPGSMFAIASMTKPIVATGIMILQDEGKLNVDDKVSKYLPAFASMRLKNGNVADREITIRDCITHTSGLAGSQVFPGTLAEAVDELATRPLAFQPGERWQYSPGLNVAGRIIEIVSKQPLQDFLSDKIIEPLGMRNTTFFPTEQQRKRIATLYGPGDDRALVRNDNFISGRGSPDAANPSGGLYSTARDMFRFYQMVLDKGQFRSQQIVSVESVKRMTSPQTGDLKTGFTPGNCWGLGWCIVRQPQGVTEMLSSSTFGHGGAFGTQGWVDPITETIYVLMIQRTKLPNSDNSDIRADFQAAGAKAVEGRDP